MDQIGFIVITAIAVILVTPYLYMRISATRAVGKSVPPLSLTNIIKTDANHQLLLYFMSENCSMCKQMTPVIEKLKQTQAGLHTIDINEFPQTARDYHVYGTPTLMVVEHGCIKNVKLGKLSEKSIYRFFTE